MLSVFLSPSYFLKMFFHRMTHWLARLADLQVPIILLSQSSRAVITGVHYHLWCGSELRFSPLYSSLFPVLHLMFWFRVLPNPELSDSTGQWAPMIFQAPPSQCWGNYTPPHPLFTQAVALAHRLAPAEPSPQTPINLFLIAEQLKLNPNKIWFPPHNLDLGREKGS